MAEDAMQGVTPTVLRDVAELKLLHALDCEAYGDANISYHRLEQWWSARPAGLQVVRVGNAIACAFGVWPLREDAYRRFVRAEIPEEQLGVELFDEQSGRWYISGIVVAPEFRGRGFGRQMHGAAIAHARSFGLRSACAIASSTGGAHILASDGFVRLPRQLNGYDLYERIFTPDIQMAK